MKIYKRKDGRYSTQIKKPDGKYKTIYGKTKSEVRQKYEMALVDFKTKPFVEPSKIGLEDWFEHWLETYTVNLRPRTVEIYKTIYHNHLQPYFGNKQLQKITHEDCQKFVNELSEKITSPTLRSYITNFKRLMSDAVKEKIIKENPLDNLLLPSIPERTITTLEPHEIRPFLDATKEINNEYADVFEFFLLTGLRFGELAGLTIDNYNPRDKTLLVEKQYVRRKGSCKFGPTKTGKSRTIVLTERASRIVEDRIKRTEEHRKVNPEYNEKNFIFIKDNNTIYERTNTGKLIKKVCSKASLPELRIHDLRHTYATITLALTGDVKTVQTNLGHASAKMTLDIYATSTDSMKRELNKKMDSFWEAL